MNYVHYDLPPTPESVKAKLINHSLQYAFHFMTNEGYGSELAVRAGLTRIALERNLPIFFTMEQVCEWEMAVYPQAIIMKYGDFSLHMQKWSKKRHLKISIQAAISFYRTESALLLIKKALHRQKNSLGYEEPYFGFLELKALVENKMWSVVDYICIEIDALQLFAIIAANLLLASAMTEQDQITITDKALSAYLQRYKPSLTANILLDYAECSSFHFSLFTQMLSLTGHAQREEFINALRLNAPFMENSDFFLALMCNYSK